MTHLVGILHDEVFAISLFHAQVDNASQYAPCIVHIQLDLIGELGRPVLLSTKDDVFRRVPHMSSRYVAEFDVIRSGQNGLHGPFGQFARVVAQLVGQDGPSLDVQFLTPFDSSGELGGMFQSQIENCKIVVEWLLCFCWNC